MKNYYFKLFLVLQCTFDLVAMEIQNTNSIIKAVNSIMDIIPLLENQLTGEDKETYKDDLDALHFIKALIEPYHLFNKELSALRNAHDLFLGQIHGGLSFLSFLLENSVKQVLSNPKNYQRQKITILSDILKEPMQNDTVGIWCNTFMNVYNETNTYIKTQIENYNRLGNIYQQNALLRCTIPNVGCIKNEYDNIFYYYCPKSDGTLSFVNITSLFDKYMILCYVICKKINIFNDFLLTNNRNYKDHLNTNNDLNTLVVCIESGGDFETLYRKLYNLHSKVTNLAVECFICLQDAFSFPNDNQDLSFKDFVEKFRKLAIIDVLSRVSVEKKPAPHIVHDVESKISNYLDHPCTDVASLLRLYRANYKVITDQFADNVKSEIEQVKKDISIYRCAEVVYLDSHVNDIVTKAYLYVEKIAKIKDHTKKYFLLTKWINDNNGYTKLYNSELCKEIHDVNKAYPSLEEHVNKIIMFCIANEMKKVLGRNKDFDQEYDTLFNDQVSLIKLDKCDMPALIRLLSSLHFNYMKVIFTPFFDALYEYKLFTEKEIDIFVANAKNPYDLLALNNPFLHMLKEKFIALHKTITPNFDSEKLNRSFTTLDGYGRIDYASEETQSNLIHKYIVTPYDDYQEYRHALIAKEKEHLQNMHDFKIYSMWANSMCLLDKNFNKDGTKLAWFLQNSLYRAIKKAFVDLLQKSKNNTFSQHLRTQLANHLKDKLDDIEVLKNSFNNITPLKELTVIYNKYMQMKNEHDVIFNKILEEEALYIKKNRLIFTTASILICVFFGASYFSTPIIKRIHS